MIATYLVMRIALKAVVDECNRIAAEADAQAQASVLKSRIAQLDMDLANGLIDEQKYSALAAEILSSLPPLQWGNAQEGGG
jgi:hypothetical protein